jgi:hypothetical protein
MPKQKIVTAMPAPNSWSLDCWPEGVYPGDPSKGKYIVRCHRDELIAAGAISRIGRDLVVIGHPYMRWLQSKTELAAPIHIAPNRPPQHAPA